MFAFRGSISLKQSARPIRHVIAYRHYGAVVCMHEYIIPSCTLIASREYRRSRLSKNAEPSYATTEIFLALIRRYCYASDILLLLLLIFEIQ